jgi:hypothetical protein
VAIAWALPAEVAAFDLAAADLPVVQMYQAGAGNTTC